MQMTAVEWLKKELEGYGSNSHLSLDWNTFDELFEQAKEMEKQQIIDAYSIGAINGEMIERDLKPKYTNPIQYYNETFKSKTR
jgi:hypothetical protein